MDKIAIISDIHANKTALEAVLKDIKQREITEIYCLGDLVSKGPRPNEVIDLIKENCKIVLKGNCDDLMCSQRAKERGFWTRLKIGENNANYLRNLPVMHEFYLSGQLVRLFHASPYSLEHIFNPMYSNKSNRYSKFEIQNAKEMFANTEFIGKSEKDNEPDIVGYGHIHTPNLYKFKNKTLFNTGSVGAANEMENTGKEDKTNAFSTLASYVILEGKLNSKELGPISFTNIRIPYDIEQEIEILEKTDMPTKNKMIFNLKTASTNFEKE
ncbi:MAG: metallophosphoesterase family protein [Clostridia bacterium]|nr:metallophosphoesterase family protein [Clostridia bacterium]